MGQRSRRALNYSLVVLFFTWPVLLILLVELFPQFEGAANALFWAVVLLFAGALVVGIIDEVRRLPDDWLQRLGSGLIMAAREVAVGVGLTLLGLALVGSLFALLFINMTEQLVAVVALVLWLAVIGIGGSVLFVVLPVLPCMLLGHKEDEMARDLRVEGVPGVFVDLRCRRCGIRRYVRQEEYPQEARTRRL